MRAVIYCRVSTKEQVQNLSLPTQEKACRDYCERNGFIVDKIFREEGVSAKTADRPSFQEMLAHCCAKKDRIQFVVVHSINRFARNSYDHLTIRALLQKHGISLRSVSEAFDDSYMGKFAERVMAASSELENDIRAARTKDGMKAAVSDGRWPFGVPIGYVRTGGRKSSIIHDSERAPFVRRAFEMMATGLYKKREVRQVLNSEGFRTLKGNPVSSQTFQQLLRNPLYAGVMMVPDWADESPRRGDFDPIVSEEIFDKVQAVLDGKARTVTAYERNHTRFPLRRFVRCAHCGVPITGGGSRNGKNSLRYEYYRCRTTACHLGIPKIPFEQAFIRFLDALKPKPEYLGQLRDAVLDEWRNATADAIAARKRLQVRLATLEAKRDRVVDAYLYERTIDPATYERELSKWDREIALAQMALHDAKLEELDVAGLLDFAAHVLNHAGRLWLESPLDQKQRLQKVLFPAGVTYSRDTGFGTTETSAIFRFLRTVSHQNEREASPTGFEPERSKASESS